MSLEQGRVYYNQNRYLEARDALAQHLRSNPEDPDGLALMALTLSELGDHPGANAAANDLVAMTPTWGYSHYVLGAVLMEAGKLNEAEREAKEAAAMEPEDFMYHQLLGSVYLRQQKWKLALESIDRSLELEPDSESGHALRSYALQMLGRKAEALESSAQSLSLSPESAASLAMHGMALLRSGNHKGAEDAFLEALRQDPDSEFAREGILESLRSRFWPYKVVWQFWIWQARFPEWARWGLWIGLWLASRALRETGRNNPALLPVIIPVVGLYSLFVFFTWTSHILANATLLFHPIGRFALAGIEKVEAVFGLILGPIAVLAAIGAMATLGGSFLVTAFVAAITLVLVGLASHLQSIPWLRTGLVWVLGSVGSLTAIVFGAVELLNLIGGR